MGEDSISDYQGSEHIDRHRARLGKVLKNEGLKKHIESLPEGNNSEG